MKKSFFALLLCAFMLIGTAAPAFALTGTVNYDNVNIGLGVRTVCTGHFNSTSARSKIVLSFVTNVNHLPQSDYKCYVIMDLHKYPFGDFHYDPPEGNMSCDTGQQDFINVNFIAAEFYYVVNETDVHHRFFPNN